jgi:hypothetical protein
MNNLARWVTPNIIQALKWPTTDETSWANTPFLSSDAVRHIVRFELDSKRTTSIQKTIAGAT